MIVCFGEAMLEFNNVNSKHYLRTYGGDTSNCAVAAARAGADVSVIGALGNDEFGQDICNMWQNEGIDTQAIYFDDTNPTGIYFVQHGLSGHEFFYYRKGSAASHYSKERLPIEVIESATILHISAISLAISGTACDSVFKAIDIAQKAGVKISFDTNLRLKLWSLDRAKAVIEEVIKHADYVFPALEDAEKLTGFVDEQKICDHYLDAGADVVALTLGAKGAYVATKQEAKKIHSHRVTLADATGAGDTFDGYFLAAIERGQNAFTAGKYANLAAAMSVQSHGAVNSIPFNKDLPFLKRYEKTTDILAHFSAE